MYEVRFFVAQSVGCYLLIAISAEKENVKLTGKTPVKDSWRGGNGNGVSC